MKNIGRGDIEGIDLGIGKKRMRIEERIVNEDMNEKRLWSLSSVRKKRKKEN